MSKTSKILLTPAAEDSEEILRQLEDRDIPALHLPLEHFVPVEDASTAEEVLARLDAYENIVHGNRRNARFFLEAVEEHGKLAEVRERLNLTIDREAADFLEERGVPAVCAPGEVKAINLLEFMLRLRRLGPTLYPCGPQTEEIPGLLQELDIPVEELALFDLKGPSEEQLASYRKKLDEEKVSAVVFHSRRSVTRTLAAFPGLDYETVTVISADKGITKKLKENGIEADEEGAGSWESVAELL